MQDASPSLASATIDSITDESLMLRYRDGDRRAFERLYQRHKGGLYRYLRRQCGDAFAEELFQDVWMNLVRARGQYRVEARFSTYLYRLAHNRVIDHYRRHARQQLAAFDSDDYTLDNLPAAEHQSPERVVEQHSQAERLLVALATLPAPQREVFLLREEGSLSLEEIADATGVSRETAKSRLRYAVARLKRSLGAAS